MISKEQLTEMYCEKKLSQSEIATTLSVKRDVVKYLMSKYKIKTRSPTESIKLAYQKKGKEMQRKRVEKIRKFPLSKEQLYDLYWNQKLTLQMIAEKTHVFPATVRQWMIKYNIPRRKRLEIRNHSTHTPIVSERVEYLKKQEIRVLRFDSSENINNQGNNRWYIPDLLIVKDNKLFAYEIESAPTIERLNTKVEKAKKAGFDGIIFYKYWRKNPIEEVIQFSD